MSSDQHMGIVKLRQGSGKDRQGMALWRKALKLKPLPRSYIKVGCHPPPPPPASLNEWLDEPVRDQVRLVEVRGGV